MDIRIPVQHGLQFLFDSYQRKGVWEEFLTLAGPSTSWVSAYIACQLVLIDDETAHELRKKVWHNLSAPGIFFKQCKWGFNSRVPADADSTIWVLLLASQLGIEPSRQSKSYAFIRRHIQSNGGISTYKDDRLIRLFTKLKKNISFAGWCHDHTCVTAAALSLPELANENMIRYLLDQQYENGEWPAYWWATNAYSTGLIAEGFSRLNGNVPEKKLSDAIGRSVNWTIEKLRSSRVYLPFELSYLLRTLKYGDKQKCAYWIEYAIDELLSLQFPDGSWESSAPLRIPFPHTIDPATIRNWNWHGKGGGCIIQDHNRCFTTASVLYSLSLYL